MPSLAHLVRLLLALIVLLLLSSHGIAAEGDPERGQRLFSGSTTFANGGAPCLACHNLAGMGMATGANYGPDLSSLYESYGPEGLKMVLQSLAFPSMQAIYAERPLSAGEQADLLAFLQQTAQLSTTPGQGELAIRVTIGVAALLLLTFLVGKRRIKPARPLLIDRHHNSNQKGGTQ